VKTRGEEHEFEPDRRTLQADLLPLPYRSEPSPELRDGPPMICNRCHRGIPEGRLICPCFAAAADRELLRLQSARFISGEATILTSGDHALTKKDKAGALFCGSKRNQTDKPVSSTQVKCKDCLKRIQQYAHEYQDSKMQEAS
jgi:hypothetical protein